MNAFNRALSFALLAAAFLRPLLAQAQPTVVWSENFDDANADSRWAVDNGTWQIGSPTVGPAKNAAGFRAFSGSRCATTGLTANYGPNIDTRFFRISSFTVPPANQNPRLRYWQWFSTENGPDIAFVEIRDVTTTTWTKVSGNCTGSSSGVWSEPSIDLSAYAG